VTPTDAAMALQAASQGSPIPKEWMVVWDKVVTPAQHALVQRVQAANPRRNRRERRVYTQAVRQLMKLGLLVPVPKKLPEATEER